MIQKPPKKLQKPSKHLQITLKMRWNWVPGGRGRGRGRGGVILVSTAIGFAIYHITRFNFFWGIISKVYHFMARNPRKLPNLQQINRFETPFKWVTPTLHMTSKWRSSRNFQIWDHHSLPFKWHPKIEGQVATFEFAITTPYPSNDLQNWRSSCNC